MTSRNSAFALVLACMILVTACEDFKGKIEGRVLRNDAGVPVEDPDGDGNLSLVEVPIVGVLIEAKSLQDGTKRYAFTDCEGYYRLSDVEFGPNDVILIIEGSQDQIDADGNICAATATSGYQARRPYFQDVQKDTTHVLNMQMAKIAETKENKINLTILDDLTGDPVVDARVDLYRGEGVDYTYFDSGLTGSDGNVTFYQLESELEDPENPPEDFAQLIINEFFDDDFRAEIAAVGYFNETYDFNVTFDDAVPFDTTAEITAVDSE